MSATVNPAILVYPTLTRDEVSLSLVVHVNDVIGSQQTPQR
jgi:hypothetical protein